MNLKRRKSKCGGGLLHHLGHPELILNLLRSVGEGRFLRERARLGIVFTMDVEDGVGVGHGLDIVDVDLLELVDVGEDLIDLRFELLFFLCVELEAREALRGKSLAV